MGQRYVLLTGASSGIGKALSERFAQEGYHLVLVARRESALNELAATLRSAHSIQVEVISQDLAKPGAAHTLVQALAQKGLNIDVLVNNAGFGLNGSFADLPLEQWSSMVQLNVSTLMELTHLLLPGMRQRGFGRILNVASVVSFMPCPNFAVYAASKAFVLSFSQALHHELRQENIRVTALCPGATATEFHEVAGNNGTMITRWMDTPEQVAKEAYRALMREQSTVISGWINKPLPFLLRLSPRSLVLRIAEGVARHA